MPQLHKSRINIQNEDFLRHLYETSFPPEERRPWEALRDIINDGTGPQLFVIETDGRAAGFITAWSLADGGMTYVEHFAVDGSMRGSGIGGAAIELLAQKMGRIILEVEPEGTTPEASRRIDFYSRHGFRLRPEIDYIQPPYAPGLPPVRLSIMTAGDESADMDTVIAELKRRVYGA